MLTAAQARYDFELTAPTNLSALFNTRHRSQKALEGGMALRSFDPTPPVSSYLVAFVIGNLTNVSAIVPGQTPFSEPRTVSVWGTPDRSCPLHTARRAGTNAHTLLCLLNRTC